MGSELVSAAAMLARAETAWAAGDGETAMAFFGRAADLAEDSGDLESRVAAVLGLARGQQYNLVPGLLPVRLHAAYDVATATAPRARLAAALARCWAYANELARAQPFARESLELADRTGDPTLLADALDAALASHWGPDDLERRRAWAVRLDDTVAHLPDPDARLQAQLWSLTVAWEVLDLPRMHRSMRAIELLADESPRAEFFAATRRFPLELLRGNLAVVPTLLRRAAAAAEQAVIPDAAVMQHGMRGYAAWFAGDAAGCAAEAPEFEEHAVSYGVATVRAEAALMWLGAGRLDKVAEMVGAFTPEVLDALPRDSDWLLTLQCVLEGALAIKELEVVAAAAGLLTPYAGRSVVNAGAVAWHGVTDDTLARAAALVGDPDTAARHEAAALATYERIGARWWRDRLRRALPGLVADDHRVVHLHEQAGGLWLVGRTGSTFVLPRMRGLLHLHRLLSEPGRDIQATALVGGETVEQGGLELLDDEARRAYRARLEQLDPQRDDDERRWLLEQLGAATGLAGRRRTTGSTEERARVSVRKAIVAALARIAEADPWLGRHLRDRIHTGTDCRYEPDPDHPVEWVLQATP
jgi:hypothetical protein